jgi:hypothetical protein
MIRGRERKNLVQVLALNPQLVFPRNVAGIFSDFKHGHDNDLHRDRNKGRPLHRFLLGIKRADEEAE